jgi:aspartate kinase
MAIVMKFGGSSVASSKKIMEVAHYLKNSLSGSLSGPKIIAVVSAMGDETDDLIKLASEIDERPDPQEMDKLLAIGEIKTAALLAIALKKIGIKTQSVGAEQIGLETTPNFGGAKIKTIKNFGLLKKNPEEILIVPGFQGVAEGTADLTTLGRGGSDATAIAIAAALKAKKCEIFTDVDGVYAVDPRLVPSAKRFEKIGYDLMIAIAAVGAGVMMDRSVKIAQRFNIPIQVLLSPSMGISSGGTLISNSPPSFRDDIEITENIIAIAVKKQISAITITNIGDTPGRAAKIFKFLKEINILDAVQGQAQKNSASISIFVDHDGEKIAKIMAENFGKSSVLYSDNLAGVTVVDQFMKETPGYFYSITDSLAGENINIKMINSGQTSISVIVDMADLEKTARILAEKFKLTK